MLRRNPHHRELGRKALNRPAGRLLSSIRAARGFFYWLLLAVGLAITLAAGWSWYATLRDNSTVAALVEGRNVEIDPNTASPNVLFARAFYLLTRDRREEAQILLDEANFRGDPKTRVAMLYDMANSRLRASFDAIERGEFDKATSFVVLAKDNYTQALRLDPGAWEVKYNLDVAARLVRDLPQIESTEEPAQQLPQELWTDLPGIPRGGP